MQNKQQDAMNQICDHSILKHIPVQQFWHSIKITFPSLSEQHAAAESLPDTMVEMIKWHHSSKSLQNMLRCFAKIKCQFDSEEIIFKLNAIYFLGLKIFTCANIY